MVQRQESFLIQGTDEAAIILNSNSDSNSKEENILSETINSAYKIKQVRTNVRVIYYDSGKSNTEVQNFINSISSGNDLIKFVTPVYYGQSKNVSQIPADEFIVRLRT